MSIARKSGPLRSSDHIAPASKQPALLRWLVHDLPYITMLLLALVGVSWRSFTDIPAAIYWIAMVPMYAVICFAAGWRHFPTRDGRLRLAYTQALHWIAVLVGMFLITRPEVRGAVNDSADALSLLVMLAVGTFLAGLHIDAWRVSVVGVFLGLGVPAISWLNQSPLYLDVIAVMLVVIGAMVWWLWRR
jgi:hypothetical protein